MLIEPLTFMHHHSDNKQNGPKMDPKMDPKWTHTVTHIEMHLEVDTHTSVEQSWCLFHRLWRSWFGNASWSRVSQDHWSWKEGKFLVIGSRSFSSLFLVISQVRCCFMLASPGMECDASSKRAGPRPNSVRWPMASSSSGQGPAQGRWRQPSVRPKNGSQIQNVALVGGWHGRRWVIKDASLSGLSKVKQACTRTAIEGTVGSH